MASRAETDWNFEIDDATMDNDEGFRLVVIHESGEPKIECLTLTVASIVDQVLRVLEHSEKPVAIIDNIMDAMSAIRGTLPSPTPR